MRVAGLMSGTSADGIDVAIVQLSGSGRSIRMQLEQFAMVPYPDPVRRLLFDIFKGKGGGVRTLARLHTLLGELYADAVQSVTTQPLDLVASHGQTVYHQPQRRKFCGREVRCTWQLGDGDVLAQRLRCPVVSDFRPADVYAGGQGAPLVSYADWALFSHPEEHRVLLNLGGMANITSLPPGATMDGVIAFDTGPANALLDAAADLLSNGRMQMDAGGEWAALGEVQEDLLNDWMAHPYFARRPPKSTGREQFGAPLAGKLRHAHPDVRPEEFLATLTAFTARTVVMGIALTGSPQTVLAAGGGVHNRTLMGMLRAALPHARLDTTDALGVPSDAREAIAFAILGYETMHGVPSNVPSATGAHRRVILGKLTRP